MIAKEMIRPYPSENGYVARRMKFARSTLENNFHRAAVPAGLNTGEDRRAALLLADLHAKTPHGSNWYEFFTSLRVTDRVLLDIYLFHVVPTQDRDPVMPLRNSFEKMHGPRE